MKEGWLDGGSIAFAVLLVIIVTGMNMFFCLYFVFVFVFYVKFFPNIALNLLFLSAVSDYRQSLQFQNLNDEKRNIQLEVLTLTFYKLFANNMV